MEKPKTKRSESILNIALELFNEQGSHEVTTNHIANALGISTGNLYHYYKNKEHIIRELLARLIREFDSLVDAQTKGQSPLDLVAGTIAATAELIYTYRFIYIELAALLARDELFKAMYHDIKERRAREFVSLFDCLAQMGAFRRGVSPGERDAVIFIMCTREMLWGNIKDLQKTIREKDSARLNVPTREYTYLVSLEKTAKPYLEQSFSILPGSE
jgi:AcrR family transcriptional regulator